MERLQKVLAGAGIGSRRQCEQLILQGRITVDKEVVKKLGVKVDPATQKICYDGELVRQEKKCYYLFYKPTGVECTNSEKSSPIVLDYFKGVSFRLFTVGRLDKDSAGLILVTNDGRFAQKAAHPSNQISRIYQAKVRGYVNKSTLEKICDGIWGSVGKMAPQRASLIHAEKDFSTVKIELKEGKNREIRRIFAKVGHPVKRLTRIQFGPFVLGELKPGQYRKIDQKIIADKFFFAP